MPTPVPTYERIATTTVDVATSTILFNSIPQTYTDLRAVLVGTVSAATSPYVRFNNDSSTNYSTTRIYGSGSAAGSIRHTSIAFIYLTTGSWSTTIPSMVTLDLFSYSGTSTNKSCITSDATDMNGSGYVDRSVGLWRNTANVTRIDFSVAGGNFSVGTTVTLYGIKAA